jgi:general secretion pathway protein A
LNFFGLSLQPFGVSPDPSFLYLSRTHREALASLVYGVETGLGFLALIAKPGMGKTTLLFSLLENLRNSARSAFLFQTQCTSREFMQFLISELGYDTGGQDVVRMQEQLNSYLLREARLGKRFVVVIDEAQNLDPSVLETVRLLSNFETPHAKLLQIVLAGQPGLADKLASRHMVQLRQRVSLLNRLEPLCAEETELYVQHRLRISGYTGKSLLTPEALSMLIEFAQGVPRNINNFCFNALSLAFALKRKVIDAAIAREVINDLDIGRLLSEPEPDPDPARELVRPARASVESAINSQDVVSLESAEAGGLDFAPSVLRSDNGTIEVEPPPQESVDTPIKTKDVVTVKSTESSGPGVKQHISEPDRATKTELPSETSRENAIKPQGVVSSMPAEVSEREPTMTLAQSVAYMSQLTRSLRNARS